MTLNSDRIECVIIIETISYRNNIRIHNVCNELNN